MSFVSIKQWKSRAEATHSSCPWFYSNSSFCFCWLVVFICCSSSIFQLLMPFYALKTFCPCFFPPNNYLHRLYLSTFLKKISLCVHLACLILRSFHPHCMFVLYFYVWDLGKAKDKFASKGDPSISNEWWFKLYLAYFILENLAKIIKTIGNGNQDDVRRRCRCARLIFACAVPLMAFTQSHFSFFASYFYQINPVIKCSSCQDRFYVPPLSDQNPCVVITNNP